MELPTMPRQRVFDLEGWFSAGFATFPATYHYGPVAIPPGTVTKQQLPF